MSKVNELLEDLFVEMIRAGCDGAGFEKEIAGVEFTVRIDIKASLDRNNRKVIKEYQEHEDLVAKEIHKREQELRGYDENGEKIEDTEVKCTYWITRNVNAMVELWGELPFLTKNGLWEGNRASNYRLREGLFPEVELLDIKEVALTILEYGKILESEA